MSTPTGGALYNKCLATCGHGTYKFLLFDNVVLLSSFAIACVFKQLNYQQLEKQKSGCFDTWNSGADKLVQTHQIVGLMTWDSHLPTFLTCTRRTFSFRTFDTSLLSVRTIISLSRPQPQPACPGNLHSCPQAGQRMIRT